MRAGGSMVGFWLGSAVSSSVVAKDILAMDGSYIARVVKEEVARSKGLSVPEVVGDGGNVDVVWTAANAGSTPPKSVEPVKRVGAVVDGVKQFEEFEKEFQWGLGGEEVPARQVVPVKGVSGQRRYNQYGDVLEE
ncbi:UNVERIFIED_CONTAM: hypothetical protein HDU68_008818 [Siphonaria sp. JEL0065]|nr:hypothetical protein HDU68_008818 [Siphonaria sp. JEL0065]